MKDMLGNDLSIGDVVVYVSKPGGRRHLVKGFIRSFSTKTANVVNSAGIYQGYALPEQVVKVPVEDQVVINKKEYESLQEDSDKLSCLEAAGVDNWSGYDYAMELLEGSEDDE